MGGIPPCGCTHSDQPKCRLPTFRWEYLKTRYFGNRRTFYNRRKQYDSQFPDCSRVWVKGLFFARWNIVRRQRRALSEEVLLHLLQKKFLCLGRTQVEAVLVHEHFHVLDPHSPRLFRDVLINALAERMAFEWNFIQPFHLALELDAENTPRAFGNRRNLIEIRRNTAAHKVRIAVAGSDHVIMNNSSG